MNIGFDVVGAKALATALQAAGQTITPRVERRVSFWGNRLLTEIRGRASGRPGPRAITGDYRRSWSMELGRRGGGPAAVVGTSAPQGRRLEHGFVGTDSLGRNYNQPPFPHVRPAADVIEPQFIADMAREAGRGI